MAASGCLTAFTVVIPARTASLRTADGKNRRAHHETKHAPACATAKAMENLPTRAHREGRVFS